MYFFPLWTLTNPVKSLLLQKEASRFSVLRLWSIAALSRVPLIVLLWYILLLSSSSKKKKRVRFLRHPEFVFMQSENQRSTYPPCLPGQPVSQCCEQLPFPSTGVCQCGGWHPGSDYSSITTVCWLPFCNVFKSSEGLCSCQLILVFRTFFFLLFLRTCSPFCSKTWLYRNGLDVCMLNTQITQILLRFWTKEFTYCCNCNLL